MARPQHAGESARPWFVSVEVEVRRAAARPELGVGERLEASGAAQLERARSRGLRIAVLARDRAFYGDELDWLVDRWVECETLCPDAVARALRELGGPVAALTSTVDGFLGPAATAARTLELRGPTPGSPALGQDEGALRAALGAAGVPVAPWMSVAADEPTLASAVGYPCVVAPVDAGRRIDVGLASDDRELRALAARHAARPGYARGREPRRRLLVEQYVPGPRCSADGFVVDGEPVVLAWSEQVLALPPELTVMAATTTRQPPTAGAEDFVRAVLAVAGYDVGPFHLEFVLGPVGPLFASLDPRPADPGSQYCVDQVSGLDTADLAVGMLLGEPVSLSAPPGAGEAASTRMVLVSHVAGSVRGITGLQAVAGIPGLAVAEVFTAVGGETERDGVALGHVLTVGGTPRQARRRAAYALDGIRVDVEELQAV